MALNYQDSETPKTVIVNGSHSLSIQGFSFTKGVGVGKFISSDTFLVGGHSWKILFYPDGYEKDEKNGKVYVSLYVELVSKSEGDVEAYTEHALLDQSGNKWTWKTSHNFTVGSFLTGPDRIAGFCGTNDFYERAKLEASSQFIKDDCLTVQCTIGVVKTIMDGSKPVSQLSELGKCYGKLLESTKGSDVTFEVEGEIFYAHKLVLSTRSPVFNAQFLGPLKEENTHIKIEEMQASVFEALLHFIYCDVIPDAEEELVGLEATIMTQHLLVAADRYGMERLKTLCESILCENIAVSTAGSTLVLAEQHGCSKLKSSCLEFIGMPKNLKAVMETDGYKNLKETCPSVVDELLKSSARCTYVCYGPGR